MYTDRTTRLPLFEMFQRCMTLHTGQPHARGVLEPVLDLVVRKVVDVSVVTDAVLDWENAPDAFTSGRRKLVCVR